MLAVKAVDVASKTAEVLDDVKAMGYGYSTKAALTVSISDMTVPKEKPALLEKAQQTVDQITRNYRRGLITEEERYKEVIQTWQDTDKELILQSPTWGRPTSGAGCPRGISTAAA